MASPNQTSPHLSRPPRKKRKCGGCGQTGHDRRNCPSVPRQPRENPVSDTAPATNGVQIVPSPIPFVITTTRGVSPIDWDKVLYIVFDLETTGRSRQKDEIIEIAALVLDHFGVHIENASFSTFVKPTTNIPPYITELTSITNDDVRMAEPFPVVAQEFIRFMQQQADENEHDIQHVILVGHNGKAFDIPFFVQQLCIHNMADVFFDDDRFGFGVDTLELARKAVKEDKTLGVPLNYTLQTLYEYVAPSSTNKQMTWHRAIADVNATGTVFRFKPFWERRKELVFRFMGRNENERGMQEAARRVLNLSVPVQDQIDDSDVSVQSHNSLSSSSDDDDTDDDGNSLGDRWQREAEFRPTDPRPQQLFEDYCTSRASRSQRLTIGLQCSTMEVNTPIRAWRQIFTGHLLDKIVSYTNEYGRVHAKRWADITRQDLEAFIAVLFISGIQKRKDKPSNWFSDNRLLENPIIKKVMSGRKFLTILRYLHCCPVENKDPSAPDYDPVYKVTEVMKYLQTRYERLFVPGQQLSLDETLLRAFGRIKFKVRIVSKAARYGIKVYVLSDAATAFVLQVLIYTGKSTYNSEPDKVEKGKTVQIVERLVEPYRDSFRTIYVDRFYTSVDLMKSLSKIMNLFITGTLMQNQIPKEIRLLKKSPEYRQMKRGDARKAKLIRHKIDNKQLESGIVGWRDRKIVYCLSNDTNNCEFDQCTRRSADGLIRIPRPLSISEYNKYMGGVDLADMRRLHCSSTIMGQNRWWLKLFFYLLDVGTSNSLILHNEHRKKNTRGRPYIPMNIVSFKMKLVEGLIEKKIDDLYESADKEKEEQHMLVHVVGTTRFRCAYCSLMFGKSTRTRWKCVGCGVPLCSMGNGKVTSDCFAMAHESEEKKWYATSIS